MYSVVIVDDEPWALIGIRKLLESRENRFRIIYETTDPVKALEVICEERPDVVFTDIRMPEISGIELMQKTRARGVEADFIVVSGFAEFDYVQQALQVGAVDYQLKPLDMANAEGMLEKLYKKLENKRRTEDLYFYISMMEGSRDDKLLLKSRMRNILYKRYQAVTVYYKSAEYIDEVLFDFGLNVQYKALKLGQQKCVFIINSNEDKSEFIYNSLNAKKSILDRAGISLSGDEACNLSMLLKTSDIASNDCFIDNSKRISHYSKAKKNLVKQIAQQITDALGNTQYKKLKDITSGMTAFFIENNMGIEDAVLLWNKIAIYASENIENGNKFMDIELLDYIELVEKFMNIEALGEYLFEQLSYTEEDQAGDANNKFKELLLYINKHYKEELFLKDLANRFYINISYCCELFRKVTGMTFSQYITDLRMQKACELLKDNSLSVTDVCDSVGYSDYFYFNKVFKKYTGCTPSKYRKLEDKEK